MELLVADDEPVIRNLCERGVHGKEIQVTTVGSGREALELLSRRPFDILLADIHMGTPGGLELTKTVVSQYPQTDVIIITGFPSLDTTITALKLGAYDYIIKPLDLVLLKAALRRCMERRRLREELARSVQSADRIAEILEQLVSRLRELGSQVPGKSFALEQDACRHLAEAALLGLKQLKNGPAILSPSSDRPDLPPEPDTSHKIEWAG